jgi:hypothetical protein
VSYPTDSVSQTALLEPVAVDDDVTGTVDALARPRWRGWIHFYCAGAAFLQVQHTR